MSQTFRYLCVFYLTIFIEGYIVLSSELLAMRQLKPFVGNGTQTISMIVGAILMPLSAGYYVGGNFIAKSCQIRKKLIENILIASMFLSVGLSYLCLQQFFNLLEQLHILYHIVQCAIFCILFLVYPIFLLGQTISLISNYFRRLHISKAIGSVLCISTLGSFFGSIFSVLLLMNVIGLNKVIIINIALLTVIVIILSKKITALSNIIAVLILLFAITVNYQPKADINLLQDLQDSQMQITQKTHQINPQRDYVIARNLERNFINALSGNEAQAVAKKSILASGVKLEEFAKRDHYNNYEFVDLDDHHHVQPRLKFDKKYFPIAISKHLKNVTTRYDLIFIDAYTHTTYLNADITYPEFFASVKDHLKEEGIFVFYVAAHPTFKDQFSKDLDIRIRQVFHLVQRDVAHNFDYFTNQDNKGIIYICYKKKNYPGNYTDDINTYYLDR